MSGKGAIKGSLSDIVEIFTKAGYQTTIYATQAHGDAVQKAKEGAGKYDRIICSGGDGTLDEVVTGVMASGVDVPIGYIPLGSTNDYGSSLGIPKNVKEAAFIAANGLPQQVDVGDFNGDSFVYVAAFGIFTETSYATPQELKNQLGYLAYVIEASKQLRDIPSYRMQAEYDGNVIYDEFIFGMVTNTLQVGGMKGIIPGKIELNDGLFEVNLIRTPRNPIELNEIVGFLLGLRSDTTLVYSFQTHSLKLTAASSVSWTLDGEYGGSFDRFQIKNRHNGMRIIVDENNVLA